MIREARMIIEVMRQLSRPGEEEFFTSRLADGREVTLNSRLAQANVLAALIDGSFFE